MGSAKLAERKVTASLPVSSAASLRKTLLIVYHSMTGGTLQMAHAAAAGASQEPSVDVRLLEAARAGADDVLGADGLIFATPETLGAMSGLMKDFFDRTYYAALDRVNGRPYACLVCAGSDGSNAVRQIQRIATGWRLRQVADALIVCTHAQTSEEILSHKRIQPRELAKCENVGAAIATGLALGIY